MSRTINFFETLNPLNSPNSLVQSPDPLNSLMQSPDPLNSLMQTPDLLGLPNSDADSGSIGPVDLFDIESEPSEQLRVSTDGKLCSMCIDMIRECARIHYELHDQYLASKGFYLPYHQTWEDSKRSAEQECRICISVSMATAPYAIRFAEVGNMESLSSFYDCRVYYKCCCPEFHHSDDTGIANFDCIRPKSPIYEIYDSSCEESPSYDKSPSHDTIRNASFQVLDWKITISCQEVFDENEEFRVMKTFWLTTEEHPDR
ncbi:hypothetical protein K432DRAFT_410538 [Lepidopterella palustris CBS 459.81]|uniref:Uncharacterized protein n=1 Tax=Lepidopterella palustris CBS 459.81 TaxID=1314670 RepID=A0A8E2DXQ9_9PEZI|nr:hypothetical protein K432DRAFT_410538 [Lepidopterella palustris CBS 459.81]